MKLLIGSIMLAGVLAGCGSNPSIDSNESLESVAHKIDRANWDGIADLGQSLNQHTGLSATVENGLLALKLDVSQDRPELSEHTHFYINADNNVQTGFQSPILRDNSGIEYMIEDDRVYEYIGSGHSWNWQLISHCKINKTTNSVEVETGLRLTENIGIAAANINENWRSIDVFGEDGGRSMLSYAIEDRTDDNVIDNQHDWELGTSPMVSHIYFMVPNELLTPERNTVLFFIDIDGNVNTGYTNEDMPNVGADFVMVNGELYRSTADGQWSWAYIKTYAYSDVSYKYKVVDVRYGDLGLPYPDDDEFIDVNIKIAPAIVDSSWRLHNSFLRTQTIISLPGPLGI
jgi:hypothetical protein